MKSKQTAVRGPIGGGRPPVTGFYWNPCKHTHMTGPAFYDTAHGPDIFPAVAIYGSLKILILQS